MVYSRGLRTEPSARPRSILTLLIFIDVRVEYPDAVLLGEALYYPEYVAFYSVLAELVI